MKKQVLLGMACVSAMAAAINLDAEGVSGTNVFTNLQTGQIAIDGRITSSVPLVKYVVFGTQNGTDMHDTMQLSDFIMRSKEPSRFESNNDYVKVKKVVGSNAVDLTTEIVKFRLVNKTISGISMNNLDINEGSTLGIMPYQLLSKAQLDEVARIVTSKNPNGTKDQYIVNSQGEIITVNAGEKRTYVYSPNATLQFKQPKKGELHVQTGKQYVPTNGTGLINGVKELEAFEAAFATAPSISGNTVVKVEVK